MMIESFGPPVCKSVVVLIAWKTLTVGKVFCCEAVLQASMSVVCDLRFFNVKDVLINDVYSDIPNMLDYEEKNTV